MKLTALVVIMFLLNVPAPGLMDTTAPILPDGGEGAVSLNITFHPPALMVGDSLAVGLSAPDFAENTTVFMALYSEGGQDGLKQEERWEARLQNGSVRVGPVPMLRPGRYHLVVLMDMFGLGNFLPADLPHERLTALAGKRISDVREFFVHPRTYATISQLYGNILGYGCNEYRVRLWRAVPVSWEELTVFGADPGLVTAVPYTQREAWWSDIEPARLLGHVYQPISGYVFARGGSSPTSLGDWRAMLVPPEGGIFVEELGSEAGSGLAYHYAGADIPSEGWAWRDWYSSVVTVMYPSTVWELDAPGMAPAGPLDVTLIKRVLSISQSDFNMDLKELGSLRKVIEKRRGFLQPATGTAQL